MNSTDTPCARQRNTPHQVETPPRTTRSGRSRNFPTCPCRTGYVHSMHKINDDFTHLNPAEVSIDVSYLTFSGLERQTLPLIDQLQNLKTGQSCQGLVSLPQNRFIATAGSSPFPLGPLLYTAKFAVSLASLPSGSLAALCWPIIGQRVTVE